MAKPLNTPTGSRGKSSLDNDEVPLESILVAKDKDVDKELIEAQDDPRISLVMGSFMLIKSSVGIGTLYLAAAYKTAGWLLGPLIMVVFSVLSAFSLHFLARIAANTDIGDYYGLGKLAYGAFGEKSAVACTIVYLFGALIAYSAFSGKYTNDCIRALCANDRKALAVQLAAASKEDVATLVNSAMVYKSKDNKIIESYVASLGASASTTLGALIRDIKVEKVLMTASNYKYGSIITSGYFSTGIVLAVSALVIFPLAMMKDLKRLSTLSILGMACVGYITILSVWNLASVGFSKNFDDGEPAMFRFSSSIFTVIANMIFAFANHFTIVGIVPRLERPLPGRRRSMIVVSQLITTAIYLTVSLSGFWAFGKDIKSDILDSSNHIAFVIGKAAIAITIVLSYPLLLDPARSSAMFLINKGQGKPSQAKHTLVTAVFVAAAGLIGGFFFNQVNPLMNIFTSLAGSTLSFIFPALYFMRLKYKYPVASVELIFSYIVLIVGSICAVIGTVVAGIDMVNGYHKGKVIAELKSAMLAGAL